MLVPSCAIADRWARRLEDPVVALASGWMRVRQRAKSCGIELPLVISDQADWTVDYYCFRSNPISSTIVL